MSYVGYIQEWANGTGFDGLLSALKMAMQAF